VATPSVTDIYVLPKGNRWYPSFKPTVDADVKIAIQRLYDLVYQLQDQVSILAQYAKFHP
jgi:hypothetical protein